MDNVCDLFIKTEVRGLDISHIMIEAISSIIDSVPQTTSRTVENNSMSVAYTGQDSGRTMFSITDKLTDVSSQMAFSLKYYNPSTTTLITLLGLDFGKAPSGAYLFKPKKEDAEKKSYTDFVKIETYETTNTGVAQHVIYYNNKENTRSYVAVIHMKPNSTTVEWEVQLRNIPVM